MKTVMVDCVALLNASFLEKELFVLLPVVLAMWMKFALEIQAFVLLELCQSVNRGLFVVRKTVVVMCLSAATV